MRRESIAVRLVVRGGVFIALGLITTIIVAWLLVFAVDLGDGSVRFYGASRARDPARGEGTGFVGSMNSRALGSRSHWCGVGPTPPAVLGGPMGAPVDVTQFAPAWAERAVFPWLVGDRPWPGPGSSETTMVAGRGWPMIALWCEASGTAAAATPAGGIVLPSWEASRARDRMLPYRPVWAGLAVDTALYAALGWLVVVVLAAVRRRKRRADGRCPGCGYDLGGDLEAL